MDAGGKKLLDIIGLDELRSIFNAYGTTTAASQGEMREDGGERCGPVKEGGHEVRTPNAHRCGKCDGFGLVGAEKGRRLHQSSVHRDVGSVDKQNGGNKTVIGKEEHVDSIEYSNDNEYIDSVECVTGDKYMSNAGFTENMIVMQDANDKDVDDGLIARRLRSLLTFRFFELIGQQPEMIS